MAGKKIKGRKRHIVVDSMGNLLWFMVHAANIHDTKSGIFPALGAKTLYPTIQRLCGDAGYRGTFVEEVADTLDLEKEQTTKSRYSNEWRMVIGMLSFSNLE